MFERHGLAQLLHLSSKCLTRKVEEHVIETRFLNDYTIDFNTLADKSLHYLGEPCFRLAHIEPQFVRRVEWNDLLDFSQCVEMIQRKLHAVRDSYLNYVP